MGRRWGYERRSFSSRVGRVCFGLLCAAGVLSGGFLLLCGAGVLSPEGIAQQVAAWREKEPEPVAPASAPAELPKEEEEPAFRGVFLPLDQLEQAAAVGAGYDGVILPMKSPEGELGYVSDLTLAADLGTSSGDPDRNQALRDLNRQEGVYTVAEVSCLRDKTLAKARPELALQRVSGSPWLDAGGSGWLDPSHPEVESYLIGVCRELAQLGFDEIVLTHCAYPTQGDVAAMKPVEEKGDALESFCRKLQGALADFPVRLSVEGEGDALEAEAPSGQSSGLLAAFHRVWAGGEEAEALSAFSPALLPEA